MQCLGNGLSPTPDENIKKFVNNLDLLIGSEQRQLFSRANDQCIKDVIEDYPLVNQQGQKFSIFSSIEKFQKFAPGAYLTFKLLKHLMLMFSIISAIALLQLMLLLKSPFYKGYESIVRINLLRFTISSLQLEDYDVYIGFDILSTLTVLIFLIYWSENLRHFAKKCNENNKLPSYLTVQLKNVSQNFKQSQLRNYLRVAEGIEPQEIYTARNYGQFLKHYAQLTETAINLRIQKQLFLSEDKDQEKVTLAKPIIKLFLSLKNQFCSIKSQKFNQKKYEPKQVFIVLSCEYDRQKILSHSTSLLKLCLRREKKLPKQFQFKACQVEPEAIAWENIGLSKTSYLARAIVVFLILCLVTIMGIILIFMLQILETASIGDAYHYHEQNLGLNEEEINCQRTHQKQLCHRFVNYGKLTWLILLTPLTIFACKKLIMALLTHFVEFRRYPTQVSRIKSQTITLSVFYFLVVAALHLFLYLKLGQENDDTKSLYEVLQPFIVKMFKLTDYSPASIHLYSDYSLDWYKEATFFIIIICSTSFNISNGFKLLLNCVTFHIKKWKARKQKTIYGAVKCMSGIDFHMEHINASMIVINYFVQLYNCPIPITVCFGLVNITFLFYCTKWTFIKYGTKPLRLGHSINRTVINMLLLGIVIHCIMAPIFLCADGIGKNNSHYSYKNDHPNEITNDDDSLTIRERYQKLGPYYLTIAVFTLTYVLLRKAVISPLVYKIRDRFFSKENNKQVQKEKEYFGLYPSYSMHGIPRYKEILKNIYLMNRIEAKRITCQIPSTFKDLKHEPDFDHSAMESFEEILDISRNYLDRQRNQKLYDQVQQIARIANQTVIFNHSSCSNADKVSDDEIELGNGDIDEIKQIQ